MDLLSVIQTQGDIAPLPGTFLTQKKDIPVHVDIAKADGVLHTLEGAVHFKAGDAIMTGIKGEQWPIPAAVFAERYTPIFPTPVGQPGMYLKRPMPVWAIESPVNLDITLSEARGRLHARQGDLIVQYAPGDYAVVQAEIFAKTYCIVDILPT